MVEQRRRLDKLCEDFEAFEDKNQDPPLKNDFTKLTARVANLESDVIDMLKVHSQSDAKDASVIKKNQIKFLEDPKGSSRKKVI